MLKEFKEFAMKGNVLRPGGRRGHRRGVREDHQFVRVRRPDAAAQPVAGPASNFSNLFVTLSGQSFATFEDARKAGAVTLNYGLFIGTVVDFVCVAFAVFILVKQVNRMRRPEPAPAVATKDCPFCTSAIPLKASRCPQCTADFKQAARSLSAAGRRGQS